MTRRVEPVSRGAAGPISLLHRVCFPDDPWDISAIEQIMRIPGAFGRIAWVKDHLAGFALAVALGEEVEILSLGVTRNHRRTGVGSALLDSICFESRLRGAERVLLEVAANNNAARSLYAANGFTVAGYRRDYYRQERGLVDALILRRALVTGLPPT